MPAYLLVARRAVVCILYTFTKEDVPQSPLLWILNWKWASHDHREKAFVCKCVRACSQCPWTSQNLSPEEVSKTAYACIWQPVRPCTHPFSHVVVSVWHCETSEMHNNNHLYLICTLHEMLILIHLQCIQKVFTPLYLFHMWLCYKLGLQLIKT